MVQRDGGLTMVKTKQTNYNWIMVAAIIGAIIIIGGNKGWFKSSTTYSVINVTNQYSSSLNPNTFQEQYLTYTNVLSFNPNVVCQGSAATAGINTNIPNGQCTVFSNSNNKDWVVIDELKLNANGDFSENTMVDLAPGTLQLKAMCCDSQQNCKSSNTVTVNINDCPKVQFTCTDTDGGQDDQFLKYGTCESTVTQTGGWDQCVGGQLVEQYCAADKTCQTVTHNCDNGMVCDAGKCALPNKPINTIFVSTVGYRGNMGGIQGADDKCTSLAAAANIGGGQWIAILSSSMTSAKARLAQINDGEYWDMKGLKIADNTADLFDGEIMYKLDTTEKGTVLTGKVWSGTVMSGDASALTCLDWTSADGAQTGMYGLMGVESSWWIADGIEACNLAKKIYCVKKSMGVW